MISKDALREIFTANCADIPAAHADNIKRAMLATAKAQRAADAAAALAQGGRRDYFICGNCAAFISNVIKGEQQ